MLNMHYGILLEYNTWRKFSQTTAKNKDVNTCYIDGVQ